MKTCTLVCGYRPENIIIRGDLIGVDRGALILIRQNLHPLLCVGDFDSVSEEEFGTIRNSCEKIIKLNPIKDDTDLEHTLNTLIKEGYDCFHIYGALGGRMDHTLLNMRLLMDHKEELHFYDSKHHIYKFKEGKHIIPKDGYSYLSLFVKKDATVSLDSVAYPLDHQKLASSDTYTTSNEIINDHACMTVHQGEVMIIQCKD